MISFIIVGYYPIYKDEYFIPFFIALLVSSWFYYDYIYAYKKQLKSSLKWLPIKGNIVSKKIINHLFLFERNYGFLPSIKYSYKINGQRYSSKQFTLFPLTSTAKTHRKEAATKLMYQIAKNKEISVYVDPKNHNNSYIYKEDYNKVKNSFILVFWSLIVFPLFGIPFYLYFTSQG